ncbi:MAG: 16S rRNA (cytosine(1402)-N(4))-methyltransferase RsmH [Pseudomonadota bacterium]|nr:16S rRNA (cytosine(1402)-N(4))-methyltransferase RsmH [Pseudomonadota bacterium]
MNFDHISVMTQQVLSGLKPRDGGTYIDGTFGQGGYTKAVLDAATTRVFGIDRDPAAITFGAKLISQYDGRLTLCQGCFGDMTSIMADHGITSVDGVMLDLGVSSPQIDDPNRGFSFRYDGPLDMRMESKGPTAADFINEAPEEEIADVIFQYGEERYSRRIARGIVEARKINPILSTSQLVGIIHANVRHYGGRIDPATRTFMALRIRINDELDELDRGLTAAQQILGQGGRLAIVAFHSLEDRKIKSFLNEHSGIVPKGSRHMPEIIETNLAPSFNLIRRGVIKPDEEEILLNPRARSARLRIAERTDAPAWLN